ncbi:discoidin domain-containing protein [Paenibacillus elgii]|uniref:discoidin domain-containing protein n=1 Tax=Paenibacillus elgii TaxID=189691 RepID=UPI00203E7D11|nr:discoidin domain-containing protein [Paenibacillus elgii]MCM3273915.1 discoidin domain-containing protein [Paenibacillus elgii]
MKYTQNIANATNTTASAYGSYPISYLYDNDIKTIFSTGLDAIPAWFKFNFGDGNPKKIVKIVMSASTQGYGFPKTWKFEGSNDGTNWTTIHSVINGPPVLITGDSQEITFENNNAYIYYRLNVTNTYAQDGQISGNRVDLTELKLMERDFEKKILFYSNGEYKKYDGVSWQTVTSNTPTEQDFLNHGMDNVFLIDRDALLKLNDFSNKPKIVYYHEDSYKTTATLGITANYSPIDELSEPELLVWVDDTAANPFELKTTAVPKPKLVLPLQDIKIAGSIQNLFLSTSEDKLSIIPKMISNNSPSPYVVSASSIWDATYDAWKAFNGTNNDSTDCWATTNNARTGWIKIDFNVPKNITQYTITSRTNATVTETPKSWTFEGSNNNADWVVLDTRKNETNWTLNQRKMFQFNNITSYRYYRLNISENNGNVIVSIGKIDMMSKESTPTLRTVCSNDSGVTWYTFKTNSWQPIDIRNLVNVKNDGMSVSEFNSLTTEQWINFNKRGKFRIAYYLEQNSSMEQLTINSLSSTQSLTIDTPTLNSLTIIYDELDKKYSGLMFMDTSKQYYSTSIGEVLKYLDMSTMIAGQTSLDIQVKLTNTYPFDVKNIQLWPEHNINGLTIEISKSNQPFNGQSTLTFDQLLFDQVVDFYIRLSVDPSAQAGGNFDICVHAEPV